MIRICERKLLKLGVLRFPQVRSQPLTAYGGKPGAADPQQQRCRRADQHPASLLENIDSVSVCHANIHNISHDQRNQKFKNGFCRNAEGSKDQIFPILS